MTGKRGSTHILRRGKRAVTRCGRYVGRFADPWAAPEPPYEPSTWPETTCRACIRSYTAMLDRERDQALGRVGR